MRIGMQRERAKWWRVAEHFKTISIDPNNKIKLEIGTKTVNVYSLHFAIKCAGVLVG